MANQERARGRLFRITPTKERTPAPVLPRPATEPVPVSPDSGKPPKRPLIQRLMNNLALRLVAAGIALGGTGYAVYHEVPAVHRAVDNLIGTDTVSSVPPTFDNTKDKGVIGKNNIISISLQEIQSQFPQQIVAEGNRITFLNPFQLPDGTSASYVKNLSEFLPTTELRQQAEKDQIKDNIDFVLPKGTVIFAPVDGHGFIDMGKSEFNEDPTKSIGVFFVYYDKKDDITYKIGLFPSDSETKYFDVQASELALPADYPRNKLRGDSWQDWPSINIGKPLVTLPENQRVTMHIEGFQGKVIGPQAALVDKTLFLVTPNFLTINNGAGERLLALKN